MSSLNNVLLEMFRKLLRDDPSRFEGEAVTIEEHPDVGRVDPCGKIIKVDDQGVLVKFGSADIHGNTEARFSLDELKAIFSLRVER